MKKDSAAVPRFFSYSVAGGFSWHETLEKAREGAENDLDYERECSGDDGWQEEDVLSICYGEVKGACFETERMPWKDHLRRSGSAEEDLPEHPRFDEFLDFALRPLEES